MLRQSLVALKAGCPGHTQPDRDPVIRLQTVLRINVNA